MSNQNYKVFLWSIVFWLVFLVPFVSAEKETNQKQPIHVLSAQNALRINRVSSPALSPNGKWIVYAKTERDMESEDLKSTTHIWKVHVNGTQRRS
ncbi:MAG: hypothetical protein GF421_05630 [Candidatus Aminicenantes bacterium]|nr:hypothetical protein [Candidatus Aminicenantes bacterium]